LYVSYSDSNGGCFMSLSLLDSNQKANGEYLLISNSLLGGIYHYLFLFKWETFINCILISFIEKFSLAQ
jgi:hypothetical protein